MYHYFMQKQFQRAVSFMVFIAFTIFLSTSVVPIEASYAAVDIPEIKHGLLVVPVAYGNNGPSSDVFLSGTISDPRVRFQRKGIYYRLNNVFNNKQLYPTYFAKGKEKLLGTQYCTELLGAISVNQFVQNASYGQDVVAPIYLTASKENKEDKKFVPFNLKQPSDEELIKDWDLKDNRYEKVLQSVMDMVTSSNALSTEKVLSLKKQNSSLHEDSSELGIWWNSPDLSIDSVVFLVNLSGNAAYSTHPDDFRSFAIEKNFTSSALSLRTAPTDRMKKSLELRVRSYCVIFVDAELPYVLIHELMHLMGVGDLYMELKNRNPVLSVYPSWAFDVQGFNVCSGPFYTQRMHMYKNPINNVLHGCVKERIILYDQGLGAGTTAGGVTTWPYSTITLGNISLNDVNYIGENGSVVLHIYSIIDEKPVDFYLEYRRPETDSRAALAAIGTVGGIRYRDRNKDGYLLIYTTGYNYHTANLPDFNDWPEDPSTWPEDAEKSKLVHMIRGIQISDVLDKSGFKVSTAIKEKDGSLIYSTSKPMPGYEITFYFTNVELKDTASEGQRRNKAKDLALTFDLQMKIQKTTATDKLRQQIIPVGEEGIVRAEAGSRIYFRDTYNDVFYYINRDD